VGHFLLDWSADYFIDILFFHAVLAGLLIFRLIISSPALTEDISGVVDWCSHFRLLLFFLLFWPIFRFSFDLCLMMMMIIISCETFQDFAILAVLEADFALFYRRGVLTCEVFSLFRLIDFRCTLIDIFHWLMATPMTLCADVMYWCAAVSWYFLLMPLLFSACHYRIDYHAIIFADGMISIGRYD